nr:immunoglobulin light chain junction region [Macaca mulatta]MOV35289.1 immunoglobulin light chain junction region [Macaca mulatta]MOW14112.1 immunoglobulin light chain junction region [Macaca mulatta]MOW35863.1 immunoglobulin light chain junction region [Macaca mulatta]
CMEGLEFPWTF